jgi:hypothetical protein
MKKIVLLNVLLAMLMAVNAQTDSIGYKSIFGRESTVWYGATDYVDMDWMNHVLQTDGDTVIDGYSYKIVPWDNWIEFYLREDTLTGKVWCRYPEWAITRMGASFWYYLEADTDYLIMDLSLETGDSITLLKISDGFMKYYVSSIDYFDSMKHVVLMLMDDYNGYSKLEFVEGAGCSNLFAMIPVDHTENIFLCCLKDGELVFHNPRVAGNDCYMPYRGEIEDGGTPEPINIYPNPCFDWLKIDGESLQSATLLNVKGEVLAQYSASHNQIDMSGLPAGIYFIRIVHNNTVSCKHIIKR